MKGGTSCCHGFFVLLLVWGGVIAALAKKDKEKDYTAIFTQENPRLERRLDMLFDGVKSRFSRR